VRTHSQVFSARLRRNAQDIFHEGRTDLKGGRRHYQVVNETARHAMSSNFGGFMARSDRTEGDFPRLLPYDMP